MEEIVVGLDGSATSNRALRWALQRSQLHGDTTLTVLHAYQLPERRGAYAYTESYLPAEAFERRAEQERAAREEAEAEALERAERLIGESLAREGTKPAGTVIKPFVVASDPADALIESSREADLLVVGSRGLGGFRGLLVGSVSQKCLHHAHCPVVVVR